MSKKHYVVTGYILITIESGFIDSLGLRNKTKQPKEVMTAFVLPKDEKAIEEQGKEYDDLVLVALERTIDLIKNEKGE